jgi:hypothetical protein
MTLMSPSSNLRIEATDPNFSHWQVYFNETNISRDVIGIMLELNRGCLPLVTMQCTTRIDLPTSFTATIEIPERLRV